MKYNFIQLIDIGKSSEKRRHATEEENQLFNDLIREELSNNNKYNIELEVLAEWLFNKWEDAGMRNIERNLDVIFDLLESENTSSDTRIALYRSIRRYYDLYNPKIIKQLEALKSKFIQKIRSGFEEWESQDIVEELDLIEEILKNEPLKIEPWIINRDHEK